MTPSQAAKLVTIALAGYPTRASFLDVDAVENMTAAWGLVLADVDYAEAQAALVRYMATEPDNLPGPGHLRKIADEARHGRTRDGGDAFGDIGRLQGQCYSSHRPAPASAWADGRARWCFDRLGGWTAWAELEVGAPYAAFRKQFIDLYNSTARHDATERSLAGLPGAARIALPEAGARPVGALLGDVTKRLTGGAS